MLLKRNKKGSLQDLIFIGIVLLVFGMVTLITFKISTEFNTQIQATPEIGADAKEVSSDLTGMYPGVVDNTFLFLVIGLVIITIMFSALVRVHPIFIPLFIIGWIFIIFISGVLSNIYTEMAANDVIRTEANQLTFITNILGVLPMFVVIVGIIIMIVLHKLGNIAE